jgi:hypothetical protein
MLIGKTTKRLMRRVINGVSAQRANRNKIRRCCFTSSLCRVAADLQTNAQKATVRRARRALVCPAWAKTEITGSSNDNRSETQGTLNFANLSYMVLFL